MSTFKTLISAVDAAEQIMNEWSDDESIPVDILILPPDSVLLIRSQMMKKYKMVM